MHGEIVDKQTVSDQVHEVRDDGAADEENLFPHGHVHHDTFDL